MKKNLILLLSIILVWTIGCASKKEVVKKDIVDPNVMISNQNEQLTRFPIGGFGYKSSRLPSQEWRDWAEAAKPIVEDVITKIPEGYVLQVTGHADASGPEEPVGNKPGNIKISNDRARTVFNALQNAGINSSKLTYKGVGSSDLLYTEDPRSPKQRRVTFKVVPKE
ncbi:MAG: OmpA family protein [Spirochaetota bacterium]|nr:OmpA family protein [Spirochaetota bacterium]